jgi:hypothetical protein
MKKVTSREFQKGFGKLAHNLKPGQSLLVTHFGKPMGAFVKTPARKIPCPNFLKNLEGQDPEIGQSILEKFHDDCLL